MRVFPVFLAAALAIGGFAALPSLAVAQDPIVITTNQSEYIDAYAADPLVHITVSGLAECAGETVVVGLYQSPELDPGNPPAPLPDRTVKVDVPASGSLAVDVPIPWGTSALTGHAGIVAGCVPGGFELGEPLTFGHADPPFGPVLPAAPLPAGVDIRIERPDQGTVLVTVGGFPACAGRAVAISLATETGGSVFADPNRGVGTSATFETTGVAFGAFKLDGDVPAGRYIVWIRSICTSTWVAPGFVDVAGTVATPSPSPSPIPRPPVVGSMATARSSGSTWLFAAGGAALMLAASAAVAGRALCRR